MDLIDDDQEWTVESFIAECDRVTENPPPAPSGMELIDCDAEPRHWPTYMAHVEGMYPAHCLLCERDGMARELRKVECERKHRRWKSWRGWWRITGRLYSLGVTASGGGVSYGNCEFCGINRQYMAPRWRGQRSYFLGMRREVWACLRRRHRRAETPYGMCSICTPCPSCGSTDPMHDGDCGATTTSERRD